MSTRIPTNECECSDNNSHNSSNSSNGNRLNSFTDDMACPRWKTQLQEVIDTTVKQYQALPPYRQTGLQCYRLFGERYQQSALDRSNKQLRKVLPNVIQRLLESLCYVTWYKQGEHQHHLYVLDETIPVVNDIYNLYVQQTEDNGSTFKWDRVVIHFLVENKQMMLRNKDALSREAPHSLAD